MTNVPFPDPPAGTPASVEIVTAAVDRYLDSIKAKTTRSSYAGTLARLNSRAGGRDTASVAAPGDKPGRAGSGPRRARRPDIRPRGRARAGHGDMEPRVRGGRLRRRRRPGQLLEVPVPHRHGFWSVLENVILGPFLAVISFACSIGNVPLAAALWSGGITFGGTIAFVFADLITLPLLLIYRRYYGTRLTLRLLAVFWATMSTTDLVTEYVFTWAGIAPAAGEGSRPPGKWARAVPGQPVTMLSALTRVGNCPAGILATSVWQVRRATAAKVIAHTRVTSRPRAHQPA